MTMRSDDPLLPHQFWQQLHAPGSYDPDGPFVDAYPALLSDGRQLRLPIRPLADGRHALASLIINQASFAVVAALADDLAGRLSDFRPDIVVGLPTLGLTLAAAVAERLGHTRYVPLGTSRKFWYVDDLSVPMTSITSPGHVKRLYLDPRMLPLLEGRRVALVDDVISTGTSILAGLSLLRQGGLEPVVIGAAMLQSERWRAPLTEAGIPEANVMASLATPILERVDDGRWRRPLR